ncbi:MAG: alginate export family protein, partial [Nanoarchaeota archaeon]
MNERNWNGESGTADQANRNIGFTANNATEENDIDLDLAYVTLKEFLYSPLSLSIGRQELRFGNGLIVGDPDTNIYSAATNLAEGDLSARKSFDAVRATLDYNPLVLDAVYAKIEEGANNLNDDVTLAGINASYALDKNTTLEGYFFSKVKGSNAAAVTNYDTNAASYTVNTLNTLNALNKQSSDKVNTLGARVVNKAIKNLAVDLQAAYQLGTYNPKFDTNAAAPDLVSKSQTAGRKAWAAQVEATYDLKDVAMLSKYSPVVAVNYTALSGADREEVGNEDYKGWDPVFEDQTYGHLLNAIMANTNMHRFTLSGKAKLTDDLAMKLDYTGAWLQKKHLEGRETNLSGVSGGRGYRMGDEKYLGQEIDAALVYDYTEDVQFSLLGGVFMPGKNINAGPSLAAGAVRA